MVQDAEKYESEDKANEERVNARNTFITYLKSAKSALENMAEKLEPEEKEKGLDAIKDGFAWLDANPTADAEETREKYLEVERICSPLFSSRTKENEDEDVGSEDVGSEEL